jgi:arylformamidase
MVYMFEGPGFSAEAAEYLTNYNLKGIGFDFISLSSPLHREEGRKAHKILLSKGILIVEDMNLANLPKEIKRLFVIPIYIKGLDSVTCTVFAELTSSTS